jgi:hypothetical protein
MAAMSLMVIWFGCPKGQWQFDFEQQGKSDLKPFSWGPLGDSEYGP